MTCIYRFELRFFPFAVGILDVYITTEITELRITITWGALENLLQYAYLFILFTTLTGYNYNLKQVIKLV